MTFTCFVLFDMMNALACRSQRKSIFHLDHNYTLYIAIGKIALSKVLSHFELYFRIVLIGSSTGYLLVATSKCIPDWVTFNIWSIPFDGHCFLSVNNIWIVKTLQKERSHQNQFELSNKVHIFSFGSIENLMIERWKGQNLEFPI